MPRLDLTGTRFGRLRVMKFAAMVKKSAHWHCLCDCGTRVVVRASKLTTGRTKSCGCWKRDGIHSQIRYAKVTQRQATARKLRGQGWTYDRIAVALKISKQAAHRLCTHKSTQHRRSGTGIMPRCRCGLYVVVYARKISHVCVGMEKL